MAHQQPRICRGKRISKFISQRVSTEETYPEYEDKGAPTRCLQLKLSVVQSLYVKETGRHHDARTSVVRASVSSPMDAYQALPGRLASIF